MDRRPFIGARNASQPSFCCKVKFLSTAALWMMLQSETMRNTARKVLSCCPETNKSPISLWIDQMPSLTSVLKRFSNKQNANRFVHVCVGSS